ncbi:hypothetical protein [Oleisolibacter albus]|uniref:hypothetical protein n=1 Tax=Oleisolibacter albus TaxID=2171757 RepID=UPI000DF4A774|nr:hypothetical protein [Oleisolibacter albus]
MKRQRDRSTWMVFRWPALLAVVSISGLTCALLGDGMADILSWLLLGSLPLVMAIAWLRNPVQQ